MLLLFFSERVCLSRVTLEPIEPIRQLVQPARYLAKALPLPIYRDVRGTWLLDVEIEWWLCCGTDRLGRERVGLREHGLQSRDGAGDVLGVVAAGGELHPHRLIGQRADAVADR